MSSTDEGRGRIKPEYSDDDDDIDDLIEFSENAEGKFRSRVDQYGGGAEFPTAPLYSVNEIVYLAGPGGSSQPPEGPYVVVSVSADRYYTIKRRDNGRYYPSSVAESRLLVKTS